MRTNIELNEELMSEARRYSTARTKRALVEEALKTFIEVREADRRRQEYGERLRALRRRTAGLKLRSRSIDLLEKDRERG